MKKKIAINGYGRIGQCILRALFNYSRHHNLEIVAINDLSDLETLTYLTRYDTTHGRFPGHVESSVNDLLVNGRRIQILNEPDPELLPWKQLDIDLVLECTGTFTDRATAERHLTSGAKRLLFSQPADRDVDATIVYGFNEQQLAAEQKIVSNASCTTNCVVPILDLLDKELGVICGVSTTIHSAMNDQPVIDRYHRHDLRLTRSAMHSLVPVKTDLSKGIAKFLPQLNGCIECLHLRIPTINVSLMDLSIQVRKPTTPSKVNAIFSEAASGKLQGLMGYTDEPHASVDFNTDPRSAIIDGTQTRVSAGKLVKILAWFDNEWSYSNRMLDVAQAWMGLGEA